MVTAPLMANAADGDDLIGTWEYSTTQFTFEDDGDYKYIQSAQTIRGDYTVDGNYINMTYHGDTLYAGTYTIAEDGDTVTFNFTDGGSLTLDRVGGNGGGGTDGESPGFGFALLGVAVAAIVLLRRQQLR